MSIATEITRLQTAKANIKTSLENKGATVPFTTKLDGYSTIIDAMPTAVIPKVIESGVLKDPTNFTFTLPSNITELGNNALFSAFYGNHNLVGVNFSNLTTITGTNALMQAFYNCSNLTGSVNLSKITSITNGQNACASTFTNTKITSLDMSNVTSITANSALSGFCSSCTQLTAIDFHNLVTLGTQSSGNSYMYYAFQNCTALTSIDFSSLKEALGTNCMNYTFQRCSSLTSVTFPSLQKISYMQQCFEYCTSLQSLSFPALISGGVTNMTFTNTLHGVTGCTVHFPINLQTELSNYTYITNGMGGTNTTILFDLPSTATE